MESSHHQKSQPQPFIPNRNTPDRTTTTRSTVPASGPPSSSAMMGADVKPSLFGYPAFRFKPDAPDHQRDNWVGESRGLGSSRPLPKSPVLESGSSPDPYAPLVIDEDYHSPASEEKDEPVTIEALPIKQEKMTFHKVGGTNQVPSSHEFFTNAPEKGLKRKAEIRVDGNNKAPRRSPGINEDGLILQHKVRSLFPQNYSGRAGAVGYVRNGGHTLSLVSSTSMGHNGQFASQAPTSASPANDANDLERRLRYKLAVKRWFDAKKAQEEQMSARMLRMEQDNERFKAVVNEQGRYIRFMHHRFMASTSTKRMDMAEIAAAARRLLIAAVSSKKTDQENKGQPVEGQTQTLAQASGQTASAQPYAPANPEKN